MLENNRILTPTLSKGEGADALTSFILIFFNTDLNGLYRFSQIF